MVKFVQYSRLEESWAQKSQRPPVIDPDPGLRDGGGECVVEQWMSFWLFTNDGWRMGRLNATNHTIGRRPPIWGRTTRRVDHQK